MKGFRLNKGFLGNTIAICAKITFKILNHSHFDGNNPTLQYSSPGEINTAFHSLYQKKGKELQTNDQGML